MKIKSYNTRKLPYYQKIAISLTENGYSLLTTEQEYIKGDADIKTICSNGHEFITTYKKWFAKNNRCNVCKDEKRLERIQKICNDKEFELDDVRVGKISFTCSEGHPCEHSLSNFYKGTNCPICSNLNRTSSAEHEIKDFIESYGFEVIMSDRTIISPYELDLFIPALSIAIEYDGLIFHQFPYKDKNYHLMKTEKCESQNIQLIHIFEDEWIFNQDKVKNRLLSLMKKNNTIYARKTKVKEITTGEARDFCDKIHIQGYASCSVKLGLFNDDVLCAVMTLGKPSVSKGVKEVIEGHWELSRFCTDGTVVGGASKLLKFFKDHYSWSIITSFADRRWSNGNLYKQLGFSLISKTLPNYWYFKNREMKRFHRFKFRKDKIKHLGEGTEWEIMQGLGWSKIYDCGSLKFELRRMVHED